MLPLLLAAITFQTDFEGGSLGKAEPVGENHWRCPVVGESDQDKRNRQANWYYFRVDGAKGKSITLDLVNLVGEYNYKPGTHAVTRNTRPVVSSDDRKWEHLAPDSLQWDDAEKRLRIRITPQTDRVWIAHCPPYTGRHLAALLEGVRKSGDAKVEDAGKTAGGRAMPLITITNDRLPAANKKVAWLLFRQHSWETGSSWAGEGAIRYLLSPEAAALRDRVIWKIFPMADPDGVARGGVRFNVNGYDLNRNWDSVDVKAVPPENKLPEITAQKKAIYQWLDAGGRVDFFLSLHNTESSEYLAGPPAGAGIGRAIFDALVKTTTFHPSSPLREEASSTTPGRPGRMSVNQALWAERKIPAFLMEQRVEFNEKLGRYPTVKDRLSFGASLVKAIGSALGAE
jgi:hypothetical protein